MPNFLLYIKLCEHPYRICGKRDWRLDNGKLLLYIYRLSIHPVESPVGYPSVLCFNAMLCCIMKNIQPVKHLSAARHKGFLRKTCSSSRTNHAEHGKTG